jgi:hypothetical protein
MVLLMSFTGDMTPTEAAAKRHFVKLVAEVRKGIFSDDKLDLLLTNPDEFLEEYLVTVDEADRAEVKGIIKRVIITGFFRAQRRAGMAELAEAN